MTILLRGLPIAPFAFLGACALQPAYQRPSVELPPAWSNAPDGALSSPAVDREGWWTLLKDPAIDQMVSAGLRDNPTLAEAAARVDYARAIADVQDARKTPYVGVEGSISRSRDRAGSGSGSTSQTAAALGARLSWEIDLWGRVRETSLAAQYRLSARGADAEAARLSVIGEIADTVLTLRACNLTLAFRDEDITSRETELTISRARLSFGSIAPVAVAAAESNLASARTERISQDESCRRLVDGLVALSGLDAAAVRELVPTDPGGTGYGDAAPGIPTAWLPDPPSYRPALPATVLLAHPGVVAAEREVAARWSEIAVARADRLPRIDLAALLTGQWIRALGSSSSYVSGSAGAQLAGPIIDGGAGAANVRAAEAAYREAAAQMLFAVRTATRDIEDGLAAQQSAESRMETAAAALDAAQFTLRANEARWRAGAIAQFELEESRRQLTRAREDLVGARADRTRAWVSLVRRAGPKWDRPASDPRNAAASIEGIEQDSRDGQ